MARNTSTLIRIVSFSYHQQSHGSENKRERKTLHFVYFHVLFSFPTDTNNKAEKSQQQNIGNHLSYPFAFQKIIVYLLFFLFAYCLITMENGRKMSRCLIQFLEEQNKEKYLE